MRFAVENAQLLLLLFSFTEVGGGGALPLLVQLLLQLLRLLLLLQLVRSTTQNVFLQLKYNVLRSRERSAYEC